MKIIRLRYSYRVFRKIVFFVKNVQYFANPFWPIRVLVYSPCVENFDDPLLSSKYRRGLGCCGLAIKTRFSLNTLYICRSPWSPGRGSPACRGCLQGGRSGRRLCYLNVCTMYLYILCVRNDTLLGQIRYFPLQIILFLFLCFVTMFWLALKVDYNNKVSTILYSLVKLLPKYIKLVWIWLRSN